MSQSSKSGRPVFFFDIDNCLYPRSARVHHLMSDLIDKYFETHLSLSQKDANELHLRYYKDYGLAIEGLVRHHKVDPLDYNSKVDDALPLEEVIKPNPQLRRLLEDIDTSKLLQIEDLFEGITFCDYGAERFVCKPHKDMYLKAMQEAGVDTFEDCYFVDDSFDNARAAQALGWTTAHLVEPSVPEPPSKAAQYQIRSLEELRQIFPQFFKSSD